LRIKEPRFWETFSRPISSLPVGTKDLSRIIFAASSRFQNSPQPLIRRLITRRFALSTVPHPSGNPFSLNARYRNEDRRGYQHRLRGLPGTLPDDCSHADRRCGQLRPLHQLRPLRAHLPFGLDRDGRQTGDAGAAGPLQRHHPAYPKGTRLAVVMGRHNSATPFTQRPAPVRRGCRSGGRCGRRSG
jgi:hypothetical protein